MSVSYFFLLQHQFLETHHLLVGKPAPQEAPNGGVQEDSCIQLCEPFLAESHP